MDLKGLEISKNKIIRKGCGAELDVYTDQLFNIAEIIIKIQDPIIRYALKQKYIYNKTWAYIAESMGYSDPDPLRKLCNRELRKGEKNG